MGLVRDHRRISIPGASRSVMESGMKASDPFFELELLARRAGEMEFVHALRRT